MEFCETDKTSLCHAFPNVGLCAKPEKKQKKKQEKKKQNKQAKKKPVKSIMHYLHEFCVMPGVDHHTVHPLSVPELGSS